MLGERPQGWGDGSRGCSACPTALGSIPSTTGGSYRGSPQAPCWMWHTAYLRGAAPHTKAVKLNSGPGLVLTVPAFAGRRQPSPHLHGTACAPADCCRTGTGSRTRRTCRALERGGGSTLGQGGHANTQWGGARLGAQPACSPVTGVRGGAGRHRGCARAPGG